MTCGWIERGRRAAVRFLALAAVLGWAPCPAAGDVLLGGALARGQFGWEAIGGYERPLPTPPPRLPARLPVDFPVRIEGHLATRDKVTNVVLSTYAMIRLTAPALERGDFRPYVATGPGFHIQGSWSDLGEFGDVVVQSDAVLKWHVLAGATLVRGERADLVAEGRYTKPGPYVFDYFALAIRIR